MTPHLLFGYVSRAHGLRGEVVVRTFDPASSVLADVERVWVQPREGAARELEVLEAREASGGDLLVTLAGVTTREAADALKGAQLFAFRDDLDAPEEGEFFQGDLVGLLAVTPEGKPLGRVEEVWSSGPVPNLVIRDGARELMVPFADDFVASVELEEGRVVVIPPEYAE